MSLPLKKTTYSNLLDMMTEDIKFAEEFLEHFPITQDVSFFCSGEQTLYWDNSNKRINFSGGGVVKPLLEQPILFRKEGYNHLPKFIQYCLDEESKRFNSSDFLPIHNQLTQLIKEYT